MTYPMTTRRLSISAHFSKMPPATSSSIFLRCLIRTSIVASTQPWCPTMLMTASCVALRASPRLTVRSSDDRLQWPEGMEELDLRPRMLLVYGRRCWHDTRLFRAFDMRKNLRRFALSAQDQSGGRSSRHGSFMGKWHGNIQPLEAVRPSWQPAKARNLRAEPLQPTARS